MKRTLSTQIIFLVLVSLGLILIGSACSDTLNIPESAISASPQMSYFRDVTSDVGIDFTHGAFRWGMSGDPVAMMGGGICWLDFDGDGWLDLFAVNSYSLDEAGRWQAKGSLPRSALFRNDRGKFKDVSSQAKADLPLRGNGCVAGDLNLDGWTDLYITTERVNILLWNNGDGTFSDGTTGSGVDAYGWQTAAAIGDLNGDSWPDLFVSGYVDQNNKIPGSSSGFPRSHYGRRDLLFINNGIGEDGQATFQEVGLTAGLINKDYEYGLGATLSDFDHDGDLDIFLANDTNPNRLFENIPYPGGVQADPVGLGFRLAEVGQFAGIGDTNSGMGVASSDYDNDGQIDLMVTNMGDQLHSVYQNESRSEELKFTNATRKIGVDQIGVGWTGWGISWADVDLDTDLDLIIANGRIPVLNPAEDRQQIQLFSNLTAQGLSGLFQDLTDVAGFSEIEPLLARGSAVADYDNDGDLDLAINSIGSRLVLLQNTQDGGHWLTVELDQFAPGTQIIATLPDQKKINCEIHAGSSYLSSEDPRCHFGLGQGTEVSELAVHWPDGAETKLTNVGSNQILRVNYPGSPESGRLEKAQDSISVEDYFFQLLLLKGGAAPLEVIEPASPEMINLGEALFWDRILSGNKDVSCATCHHPQTATGDGLSLSVGVGGSGFGPARQFEEGKSFIPRNAPEVFNRGVHGWVNMFWDGRVAGSYETGFTSPAGDSLPENLDNIMAAQAMFPVTSRDEMRGDQGDHDIAGQPNELAAYKDDDFQSIWAGLMERIIDIPEYRMMFQDAYPNENVAWLGFEYAANAIAAYQMATFTYTDSPWDQFLAGKQDALSPAGKRGAELFYGMAGCSNCHNGPLLTDQQFHNIGIPQLGPGKEEDAPIDSGRGRLTGLPSDEFAFRTPPLRNVELTGPWMHNGAFTSLEAAVKHHLYAVESYGNYDRTQINPVLARSIHPSAKVLSNLSPDVQRPIQLSDQEFADLMAFLSALTSPSSLEVCELIPESVPSGLPVEIDPDSQCK